MITSAVDHLNVIIPISFLVPYRYLYLSKLVTTPGVRGAFLRLVIDHTYLEM